MTDNRNREANEVADPLGLAGIEFIEYATSRPQALGLVLEMMGTGRSRATAAAYQRAIDRGAWAVPRSLSALWNVGFNLAAAVHFSPAFCPIAKAMGLQIRQKLSSLGPNFASTPQVRQAPRSLSALWNVGCNLAAAVHFSPAFCPIAKAMGLQIRQKLSSLGPNFASTPQIRQAPSPPNPAPARLNQVRSAVIQEVKVVVGPKARIHAACPAARSGQLRFLGSMTTTNKYRCPWWPSAPAPRPSGWAKTCCAAPCPCPTACA